MARVSFADDDGNIREVNIETLGSIQNITESKYLELAEEMKDIVEKKDMEVMKAKRELASANYLLYKTFGIISFILDIFGDGDFDNELPLIATINHNLEYIESQFKEYLK